MREKRSNEIPISLDLSVEVWFGYDGDISVTVLKDGVNKVVTRHFSWDELLDDLDYVEPNESLRELADLQGANHKKAILKRMRAFVKGRGIKR